MYMQSTLFAVIFSILISGILTACKQDALVDSQDIDAPVTQSDTQTKVNNSAVVEKAAAKNDFSDVKALYQSMIGETDDISKVVNNTTDIAFADLSTPTDTRITGFSTKYDNFGFFKGHLSNIIRYDMELTYLTSETDIEKLYVRFRDDLINYDSSLTEKKSIRRDKGEYKEVVGQIRNDSDNYFFTISREPDQATVFNLTFTRSATYKISEASELAKKLLQLEIFYFPLGQALPFPANGKLFAAGLEVGVINQKKTHSSDRAKEFQVYFASVYEGGKEKEIILQDIAKAIDNSPNYKVNPSDNPSAVRFNGVPFATGGMTALPQDEYYVINFRGRQRE